MDSIRSTIMLLVALLGVAMLTTSCEDPLPTDYVRELVVEGFVIADRPLTNIRIYASQPITDTFRMKDAVITDAEVIVLENGTPVPVHFVVDPNGGHYEAVDTSFRVKHASTYSLTVRAIDVTATATARTMPSFNWVKTPKPAFQYPGEAGEKERFDSLDISWESVPGVSLYIVAMDCLDTLGYGHYLEPPTSELNRRIRDSEFDEDFLINSETARHGPVIGTSSPVVWSIFRWFGTHRIHVYAGETAFQKWFQQAGFGGRSTYDYRLGNVSGALGIWAGASEVTSPIFLIKDQP